MDEGREEPTSGETVADRDKRSGWQTEIAIAIVLAVAGLASAWASFQAGIWDKREAESYAESNSSLTESSQLLIVSGQEKAVSANLFLQWLDATADNQPLRAEVIANHMPPWFAAEFARWRKGLPADLTTVKPNAPLPVFDSPSMAGAHAARATSDAARREAERAGRTGDSYDVANVILATALFLAGISSVLHRPRGQRGIVLLAALLTVGAVASMLTSDVLLPG